MECGNETQIFGNRALAQAELVRLFEERRGRSSRNTWTLGRM
jgi:hypothetical protein